MKIGIMTFHQTNNYGAILQNYALQKAIIKNGAEVETIDYQSKYIGKPYRISHLKSKGVFGYLFGVAGYFFYLLRTRKCNQFRKLIDYSAPVKREQIDVLNEKYDKFITGSDQVWNYKLTGMDYGTYMLDFVRDKSKCNSYAASVGLKEIESNRIDDYKRLLENYAKITVREKNAVDVLQSMISKRVELVLDPCFLLTREEWKSVAKKTTVQEPYVLVYQLIMSADVVRLAQRLAKEKHLKVIYIPFPMGRLSGGKWILNAGPAELLGYIQGAEYIVTDSFHGTVFSIIFQKKFFTKINVQTGVGIRIYNMLENFGLLNRMICENIDIREQIDYTKVKEVLEKDRKHSLTQLEEICKDVGKN